jgi:hypothetical protein
MFRVTFPVKVWSRCRTMARVQGYDGPTAWIVALVCTAVGLAVPKRAPHIEATHTDEEEDPCPFDATR